MCRRGAVNHKDTKTQRKIMNEKITVIHHSADFDGIFCREIARKFLPGAQLIGWDWSDPKISFPGEGTVYVLDLSPDCFGGIYPGDRLIWIDHHKSAIDKYDNAECPRLAGYRIDGVAACRLAWQWFVYNANDYAISASSDLAVRTMRMPEKQEFIDRTVTEPYAVRLAGEYDIWDKRDPNTDVFQFGLRSMKLMPGEWKSLLSLDRKLTFEELSSAAHYGTKDVLKPDGTSHPILIYKLIENGELLMGYQRENDASVVNHRSFLVEWEGLKFLALTTARCNSLTFAAKDVPETGHDALMGFYYTGGGWTVSLYHANHRKDLDLSVIAVKHGGGGHRGACGFQVDKLPFLA
jgi:hypothetical protein